MTSHLCQAPARLPSWPLKCTQATPGKNPSSLLELVVLTLPVTDSKCPFLSFVESLFFDNCCNSGGNSNDVGFDLIIDANISWVVFTKHGAKCLTPFKPPDTPGRNTLLP